MSLPQGDIVYTCTALYGTGLKGELKPMADGYWRVLAGAIGYANNAGDFYAELPARECILGESSSFQRKLKKGVLYGEVGHPRRDPSMSREAWFDRLLDIREPSSSHHIRKVELCPGMRDEQGRTFTGVILEVKPTDNEHGRALKANLENNSANTYFSIRSFTNDVPAQGRWVKNMRMCITFDWVHEGGILPACKYSTPGLESYKDEGDLRIIYDKKEVAENIARIESGTGLEHTGIDRNTLVRELGLSAFDYRKHPSLAL